MPIYDDLVDRLGKGIWGVSIGGINHFVDVGEGVEPWLKIYLNDATISSSVRLKKGSISLSRDSSDYAKTILKYITPEFSGVQSSIDNTAALQTLISLENNLNRTFSPKLFKTIFKALTENGLEKQRFELKCNMLGVVLYKQENQFFAEEPYLSIRKHEQDKDILGRLLCGVYLFHAKDGADPRDYDRG